MAPCQAIYMPTQIKAKETAANSTEVVEGEVVVEAGPPRPPPQVFTSKGSTFHSRMPRQRHSQTTTSPPGSGCWLAAKM